MIGPGEILTSPNILERIGKLVNWIRAKRKPPTESIAARFIRLFESHNVHRNQIPRYLGTGLTLKDIQDESLLLAKLDDSLLDNVCAHFAVNREWLDGADAQIYDVHDFHTQPEDFADFLDTLQADNPEGELRGILIAPNEQDRDAIALLVLEEAVGYIGEKTISRYYLCKYDGFCHGRARAYLTACVAIAGKKHIPLRGVHMPVKTILQWSQGTRFLPWSSQGMWSLTAKKWYPEEMALQPEAFLQGIDPELDNFGIRAGLELWLQLESQGFMDMGRGKNPRPLFLQKLASYSD